MKIIKTRLEVSKGQWVDELPGVLWAYRTTLRSLTGETPYAMAFGCEAVIPVEVGKASLRIHELHVEGSEKGLRLNLDLL